MKTLYLVRHAKASWDFDVHDWERPLTEAGIERAQKVAKALKAKKINPDKIISSYAFRSMNTAVIFALTLHYPITCIKMSEDIYLKKVVDILHALRNEDDKLNSIMLFGHDPSITELYNKLTGKLLLKMGTSSVAAIQFTINHWKDLGNSKGKTLFLESGK